MHGDQRATNIIALIATRRSIYHQRRVARELVAGIMPRIRIDSGGPNGSVTRILFASSVVRDSGLNGAEDSNAPITVARDAGRNVAART